MRHDKFSKNINQIISIAQSHSFYSVPELRSLLQTLKDKNLIAKHTTFDFFYKNLIGIGLTEHTILVNSKSLTKYSFKKNIDIYEFAISFKKTGFFSMSTVLNLQGYSDYRDDFIFVSNELTEKDSIQQIISQEDINNAFSKPYRRTHFVGQYQNKNIVFLTPKYTQNYSVIEKEYKMSSINRSFVEMIINVQYFKNSLEIIKTFTPLKTRIDHTEVFDIIDKFNLIYPYFQCVGYYLEKIGFTKSELIRFKNKVSELKFYTDKNQDGYKYDTYWNMYHI